MHHNQDVPAARHQTLQDMSPERVTLPSISSLFPSSYFRNYAAQPQDNGYMYQQPPSLPFEYSYQQQERQQYSAPVSIPHYSPQPVHRPVTNNPSVCKIMKQHKMQTAQYRYVSHEESSSYYSTQDVPQSPVSPITPSSPPSQPPSPIGVPSGSKKTSGQKPRQKKPPTAYNLYYKEEFQKLRRENPSYTVAELSSIIAERWRLMPKDQQASYYKKQKESGKPEVRKKRPLNAYHLFCKETFEDIKKNHPTGDVASWSRKAGAMWKKLTADEQRIYYDKATVAIQSTE